AYDDIFAGVFWPASYTNATFTQRGPRPGSGERNRKADVGFAALSPEFARICSENVPGLTSWPFERIEQAIRPTGALRAAFDDLKAASLTAIGRLHPACPTSTPPTAIGRLDAIERRLDAMLDAIDIVRPALERFYGALSDEQKAALNAIGA